MKIRRKLHILTALLLFSLISITSLSLWNGKRVRRLNQTIFQGQELLKQTQRMMGLMKDIVFDLFAPQMYGQIRSLTFSPRSLVTHRTWQNAVEEYQKSFDSFVEGRELDIFQEDELQDIYDTALTLNQKALDRLNTMSSILLVIQAMDLEGESLYKTMQSDEELIPFFRELQDTSYYFTNTFESYMEHFFTSFREKSLKLERDLYILFIMVSMFTGGISILYARLLSLEILSKIHQVDQAFSQIARGNFNVTYTDRDKDELSALLGSIINLTGDLKANINGILNLTRDMGTSLVEGSTQREVLELVAETVISDTMADRAAVYLYDPLSHQMVLKSQRGGDEQLEELFPLDDDEYAELRRGISLTEGDPITRITLPLLIKGTLAGLLTSCIDSPGCNFSDLGIIRMNNYADYVSLALDNHMKYREVLEKREAEYNALQSQVQPHFIYNVLNGFVGLNRLGDRSRLEEAILSLREMLRYVTYQEKWTTLGEEIDFLITYCELQKIRFGERLSYRFAIPDEIRDFPLPRLLLQPLVENAIVHGLEPSEEGGMISLEGEVYYRDERRRIVLTLKDEGVGFEPTQTESHVGLKNVTERLKMAFPGSDLLIHSTPGEGTTMLMTIMEREQR